MNAYRDCSEEQFVPLETAREFWLWENDEFRKLGEVGCPANSQMGQTGSEPKFSDFDDKQLMDFVSYSNSWCRGGGQKDFSESVYVCKLRDASWEALERRGYCYNKFGEVMFTRCK